MIKLIGRIKEGVILTFTAFKSGSTAKDVGKEGSKEVVVEILKHIPEFAKIVPFLDKLIEFFEKTGEIVEKNEVVRFYKTIRDASEKAGIGDTEINFREFLNKLKEEFETFNLKSWSKDPIDVPGATLVLEMAGVKDYNKMASYYYYFRRLFIENFKDYYEELKTRDGEIKFLDKLEEAKRFADYKFLEKLEEEIGRIPPIKEYYQPNPCCRRKRSEWIKGAKRDCSEKIKDVRTVIYGFINSSERALLLAADFGTGKTTASRYFVSELAEKYCEHGYLPLYFRLPETTPPEIKEIIESVTTMYEKMIVFLDGLDEVSKETRNELLDFVNNYLSEHKNIKIVVTSRFGIYLKDTSEAREFLFNKLRIKRFYYQLMPLTEELAENMLEKLGGLSLDEVRKLGISEEEYTKPIYLYLLWVLKRAGKLEKLKGYGKSGIYLALTNLVSRYKAKCVEDEEVKEELKENEELKARNVLIHIAVLRTMFESEELSKGKIEELLSDDVRKYPDEIKIETDFLITTYLRGPDNLTFIHKSFQEYLSAEYLFVSFLSGHFEGFYLFPVTQEIFDFLKGLVKMFYDYWENNKLDEFGELLNIANIKNPNKNKIKEKIDKRVKRAKEVFEGKEFYIIPDIKFENSENENKIELNKNPEEIVIKFLTGEDDEREEYSIVEIYRKNVARFKYKFYRVDISDIKSIVKNFVSGSIALMEVCQIITGDEFLVFVSETIKDTVSQLLRANKELHSIDLRKADLRKAVLSGADLSGADLSDAVLIRADLRKAVLSGADLSGADLSDAVLIRADLSDAKLRDAKLSDADLRKADLSDAKLSDADLIRADLSGTVLSGADLSDAVLIRADLSDAKLSDADLIRADLSGTVLRDAKLRDAVLRDAVLIRADLSGTVLRDAVLIGAKLSDADLRKADLRDAVLIRADLSGTVLRDAVLIGAKLIAVLSDADLRKADLRKADLSDAKLSDAVLIGADLSGAKLNNISWKFNPPIVKGADFKNAKINDREFVEYLRKNGAKNVPDPVED